MDEVKDLTTIDQVKAFSDPFRYRILMTFYKIDRPATVKEVAVEMNVVPANVHYHVKKMEKAGILKLVHTKEINGIIAKYYQPTAHTFDVKCAPEINDASKKLMLAEGQKMLAQFYDDSKNIFIEQLTNEANSNERFPGTISLGEMYLTDEEADEFKKYVKDFIEKYKNKDRNIEGTNKHHCFFSIVKMKCD